MTMSAPDFAEAAETIMNGGLVAMPTETVYGLAADATNDRAVARIFEAKGRPQFNPLIIHVTGKDMAERYVKFPPLAEKLARAFWPGPLTLVLPRRDDCAVSHLVSAGLGTIAVRAPNHAFAQKLIEVVDRPLAAPSANRSGTISPTRTEHVQASLGDKVDLIIDGGPCSVGVESTIIKVDGDKAILLRPGGIAREDIEDCVGRSIANGGDTKLPEAPGMLASHYAPRTQLRLNVTMPKSNEAFLAFGASASSHPYTLNLSENGDLLEAAANLFAHLHALDDLCAAHGLPGIAAAPVPAEGLGAAINDRLKRAAAPRN
ncbi:MAG: L-threonylcarbamoyladenylate synthase [Pseudomonadota bacterium]